MSRINQDLLAAIIKKSGLSRARVYSVIEEKVRSAHLPRQIAAIAVAAEKGINIAKFASPEELSELRGGLQRAPIPSPVTIPSVAERQVSHASKKRRLPQPSATSRRRGTTVFVVHGRNTKAKDAMFSFLRAIGLKPLEWIQAIRMTKQPSPYVGTILETAFREAAAIIVLLTPDDDARLKKHFLVQRDPQHERVLTGQARPNVIFEAGMAFGRDANSTVLVQIGDIRPFSDVAGRHIVHMGNTPEKRNELVTKLANAGCNVDTSGSDWYSAGDFS